MQGGWRVWEWPWGRACRLVGPEWGQWQGGEIARMLSLSVCVFGRGRGAGWSHSWDVRPFFTPLTSKFKGSVQILPLPWNFNNSGIFLPLNEYFSNFTGHLKGLLHRLLGLTCKDGAWELPRWLSGKESDCQFRRQGFNPWSGKIAHAPSNSACVPQLLSLCSRPHEPQLLRPEHPQAVLCNKKSPCKEKAARHSEGGAPTCHN